MNDKIIVTNLTALKAKYGTAAVSKIRAAITTLIAADKARGFHTRLFALDRASDMKKVKGCCHQSAQSTAKQTRDRRDLHGA